MKECLPRLKRGRPKEKLTINEVLLRLVICEPSTLETGCWEYPGSLGGQSGRNYCHVTINGRSHKVHRLVYEHFRGPIPEGLTLDHLCRNRRCANPDHLEPVPSGENTRRGRVGEWQRSKIHCPQGHEYAGENLYVNPAGKRLCRECQRAAQRNCRNRRSTINLEARGKVLSLVEWSKRIGVPYDTLRWRLKQGWPPEEVLGGRR